MPKMSDPMNLYTHAHNINFIGFGKWTIDDRFWDL